MLCEFLHPTFSPLLHFLLRILHRYKKPETGREYEKEKEEPGEISVQHTHTHGGVYEELEEGNGGRSIYTKSFSPQERIKFKFEIGMFRLQHPRVKTQIEWRAEAKVKVKVKAKARIRIRNRM
jgi:hypothetical protein